eukprot:CAMPEP_0184391764 /NCGR_PEP_ID=MMETSP0007-20130409/16306_1 /TAXON_ID=97485 /ORGANISM="Prymnesium parvum, Strain Texoma1" /LENGTH=75 /DNA_ID=CAMNT_0026742027 /DNA_START=114 /DNA_END=338 /DNA_ORIENTATION=+
MASIPSIPASSRSQDYARLASTRRPTPAPAQPHANPPPTSPRSLLVPRAPQEEGSVGADVAALVVSLSSFFSSSS